MRTRIQISARRGLALVTALILLLSLTAAALGEEKNYTPLEKGNKNNRVLEAKKRLFELGYYEKQKMNNKYNDDMVEKVREFQELNGLPVTGTLDEESLRVLYSDAAVFKPHPTLVPLATPGPKTEPDWPERDGEGFLNGSGEYVYENDEEGLWICLTSRLQIRISREQDSSIPLVWFETDIRVRNGETLRTVMTDPEHPGKKFRYPADISEDEKLILGFSDDFYAARMSNKETVGIIIREGQVLSSKTNSKRGHHLPNLDMLVQYPDGSLKVLGCNEKTADELLSEGAVNVFSFGPILLRDGVIEEMLYSWYKSLEPRHALGIIEPGHYFLLSVQGRNDESKGTTLQRVAEMMKEHGVTDALNLDGGNTMALVFRGRMLNKLAVFKNRKFVRTVTSLIGIGTIGQE